MPDFPPAKVKLVRKEAKRIIFRYARPDEHGQDVINKNSVLFHLLKFFKKEYTGPDKPSALEVAQIFTHKILKPAEAGNASEKDFGMVVEECQLFLKEQDE